MTAEDLPQGPPVIPKFLRNERAYRDVPRRERLIEVVCTNKAPENRPHLIGVVAPRRFSPDVVTLATSEGTIPLSGRHVLGQSTDTPIVQTLPAWFAACNCGQAHELSLDGLRRVVVAMRGNADRLPRRLTVAALSAAQSTP